jgi:hypothetical protein
VAGVRRGVIARGEKEGFMMTRIRDYCTGSRDYLERAKRLRASRSTRGLLYAALELRFGIEARLHEYLDGSTKSKKGQWQIRVLVREIEDSLGEYTTPVVVTVTHPESGKKIKLEYTPVGPALKQIGERLGEYLHHTPARDLRSSAKVLVLANIVDAGIEGLSQATRGTLIGAPCGAGGSNRIQFRFEKGMMPAFFKTGQQITCSLKTAFLRRENGMAVLRVE